MNRNLALDSVQNPTVEGTKEHMGYHSYGNKAEALGSLIKGYCIASEKWVQEEGPEYFLMPRGSVERHKYEKDEGSERNEAVTMA